MPDVRPDGTERTALSVAAAGSTIASLLSDEPEDTQGSEAPRQKPVTEEVDEEEAEPNSTDDSEHQSDEEEESDEQEVEDESQAPEPRKIKVKVDGQEIEVTEEEAAKGYSRTADYTRKTQAHAEKVKAFEAEAAAVRDERQRYAQQLAHLDQLLTESVGAEPDWDTLRQGDPAEFAATYAAWAQHKERVAAVRAERAKAEAKVLADQTEQVKAHLASEAEKLVAAIPEWKDTEKAKAAMTEIAEYARTQGYTDEELGAVMDHRVFKILRDASLYRKSLAKKPEIEKKIADAKVLAPGSSAPRRPVSEITRRKQALAKTHTLDDAASVLSLMID